MAVLRSDIIVPEVFTPYVIEQTTLRDAFLASGVVQPLAELNATAGGDFVNVPFWKANLSGDFEVLTDSSSLTPGKITADKQVGVILHRGRAFESRDLAALAAGSDPMAAIGQKDGAYAVLEVKTNEVPFTLIDGQTIARIKYEKLNKNSNTLYGSKINSNYQHQALALSKHFV